jgi:molybdopterin-containing oxidoreductase family iron-sulfur binding subunit
MTDMADDDPTLVPLEKVRLPGSRRDFFKVMGLSATAAMAACRRAPEQRIFPYTRKPDEVIPGVALWYASACGGCAARCGLLVKTRDGRPIKIEGNPEHPVSRGAVCAVGQASVLGLYDADRARGARLGGRGASWTEVDRATSEGLAAAARAGRAVRVVVPWGLGPSMEAALDSFLERHPTAGVVRFDPLGQRDAIAEAHRALYGMRLLPDYRIDAATAVASFDADFLGTWLAPAPLARQWSAARDPGRAPGMLRHVQLESNLSITGGAADQRIALPPSLLLPALAQLVTELGVAVPAPAATAATARAVLSTLPPGGSLDSLPDPARSRVSGLAAELARAGRAGLVVCGSDDPAAQLLTALANARLDNQGTTAVLDTCGAGRRVELGLGAFAKELAGGRVGAVLFAGTNPALCDRRIAAALPAVAFSLSTSERLDETAALCTAHAPEGHWLEAWSDDRPRAGVEVMAQPCVAPLFDTRPRLASLLAWSGAPAPADQAGTLKGFPNPPAPDSARAKPEQSPRDCGHGFVKARWERDVLETPAGWDQAVRDGVVVRSATATPPALVADLGDALALARSARVGGGAGDQLVLYASVGLHDGTGATPNNGWLQELPDPISKVTWGNYAALAPARADALGLADGDVVELRAGGMVARLPALRQPGLPPAVVAVALGHGRARAGHVASGHGADVWALAAPTGFGLARAGIPVTVAATGEKRPLALTQTHGSQEGRELVREVELGAALRARAAVEPAGEENQGKRGLWPGHKYEGHRWGLAIDLNRCTGCGACVVSCSAENNVPVVGELEVRRRREMHWMRIDRYYGGAADAPELLHQPMMCQHCENAPCETVCPVVATVHSSEGLNQQIYNRCVGTRYCANNCPTKARRFNWFDYDRGGDLARMALNPDVVVRSRGVMEKCSMCVHRIEEARALAHRQGRDLAGGDIQMACQQSCPADAIVFGDRNDPASALSRRAADRRAYHILDEIHVLPQVTYLARVKNRGGHSG